MNTILIRPEIRLYLINTHREDINELILVKMKYLFSYYFLERFFSPYKNMIVPTDINVSVGVIPCVR